MVAAVILAGGSSLRFGGVRPKQFYTINGKELLSFSLSVFKSCSNIDEIVLVVPENYLSDMKLKYPKLKVVSGGKTRKESSYNGLKACSTNTEKVLIHDAARIFITKKMIDDCLVYLDRFDAVSLSIPLVDTVSICKNNEIKKMLNRDELRALQTPQGFNFNKIKLAHEKYNEDATDDVRLMFEDGLKCKIIDGHENNFKITTKNDFENALNLIKHFKL